MSKSPTSAGQPGPSRGSVEATGQEPPHARAVSAEAILKVMGRIVSHAITVRQLLDEAAQGEQEEVTAALEGAYAVTGHIGALADATTRALGGTGCYSDTLGWVAPELRKALDQLTALSGTKASGA